MYFVRKHAPEHRSMAKHHFLPFDQRAACDDLCFGGDLGEEIKVHTPNIPAMLSMTTYIHKTVLHQTKEMSSHDLLTYLSDGLYRFP